MKPAFSGKPSDLGPSRAVTNVVSLPGQRRWLCILECGHQVERSHPGRYRVYCEKCKAAKKRR